MSRHKVLMSATRYTTEILKGTVVLKLGIFWENIVAEVECSSADNIIN